MICQFAQDLHNISDICISTDNTVYVASQNSVTRFSGITTYDINGMSPQVFVKDIHVSGMYFDTEKHLLHVCDIKNSCIKVYSKTSDLPLLTYGANKLSNPSKVAVHPDGYSVVLESVSLFVFLHGRYLYSIDVSETGISDISITSDGALWILIGKTNRLVRTSSVVFHKPPPPLSLLCESTILIHMNELPVSSLPPKYIKLLKEWCQVVDIFVANNSSFPQVSAKCSSPVDLVADNNNGSVQTVVIKKDSSDCGIRLMLEKKLNKPIKALEYIL